jgi:hypothetical protein
MPRNNLGTSQVTVTGAATLLVGYNPNRVGVLVTMLGTTTDVWIGDSDAVTPSTGSLLPNVKGAALSLPFYGAVYGITTGGSQGVSVLEIYN